MSARRGGAFRALRLVGTGLYKATRLTSFLSAGLLDRSGLRRQIEDDWEDFLADERGSSLLLIGAGSGRDLLAFLEAGHRVEGVGLTS